MQLTQKRFAFPSKIALKHELQRAVLLVTGAALSALAYALFQVPFNLAAGGLGGVALIVNKFTGWPVGLLFGLLTLPLLILGYRELGRWYFVNRTIIGAFLFSVFTDLIIAYAPLEALTEDVLLSAVYGGIIGGIGGGLVYRAGCTLGGTGIISRTIQLRTGLPLSQVYFYTDGVILLALGFVFGWEVMLYGWLMLFLYGIASDYILEGASNTRTAMIITTRPDEVAHQLTSQLHRGITSWEVKGHYTDQNRTMLMCTVQRPQVTAIKHIVATADPDAFVTIGISHQAFGEGFSSLG